MRWRRVQNRVALPYWISGPICTKSDVWDAKETVKLLRHVERALHPPVRNTSIKLSALQVISAEGDGLALLMTSKVASASQILTFANMEPAGLIEIS